MVVMEDVVVVRRKGKTELRVVQLVTSPSPPSSSRPSPKSQVSLSGGADGAARGTSRPPPPPPRSSLKGPLATSLD